MQNFALYANTLIAAFLLSLFLTWIIIKTKAVERRKPQKDFGKIKNRKSNVLRFGGVSIILSFILAIVLNGNLLFDSVKIGLVVSLLLILIFGVYDDFKDVSWKKQLLAQIFICFVMIYFGLNIDYIANPIGGEFRLDQFNLTVFGAEYSILGSIFILIWIVCLINVVNWLDGIDGLAGGVGFIGFVVLFLLSVSDTVNQPPLGIISIAAAGSVLGFLIYNFYPSKIFMGTSGSMFIGFMLGTLSIFSGGKIATALLVLGFPILDAVWVIAQRIMSKNSPFKKDTRHLHYKLLNAGLSEKNATVFIYFLCAVFGMSALFLQSKGKILSLLVLFSLMTVIIIALYHHNKNKLNR